MGFRWLRSDLILFAPLPYDMARAAMRMQRCDHRLHSSRSRIHFDPPRPARILSRVALLCCSSCVSFSSCCGRGAGEPQAKSKTTSVSRTSRITRCVCTLG